MKQAVDGNACSGTPHAAIRRSIDAGFSDALPSASASAAAPSRLCDSEAVATWRTRTPPFLKV